MRLPVHNSEWNCVFYIIFLNKNVCIFLWDIKQSIIVWKDCTIMYYRADCFNMDMILKFWKDVIVESWSFKFGNHWHSKYFPNIEIISLVLFTTSNQSTVWCHKLWSIFELYKDIKWLLFADLNILLILIK